MITEDKDDEGEVAGTKDTQEPKKEPKPVTKSTNNTTVPTTKPTDTKPISIKEVEENESPPLGSVKKGDIIAYQGHTGCTTGSHLHFATYLNGTAVNPKTYLDSGEFQWPLANPKVTQWWGNVWSPSIPPHNGIDMIEYEGAPVYAVADGILTHSKDSSSCSITGTVGQGVIIDHGNELMTIYWHVQDPV